MGMGTPRRTPYPPEFRARAVELARTSGLRPAQVAQDLGVDPDTIRRWLRQAEGDAGRRDGVSTDAKAELARLQREVAQLKEEREMSGLVTSAPAAVHRLRARLRGSGRPRRPAPSVPAGFLHHHVDEDVERQ